MLFRPQHYVILDILRPRAVREPLATAHGSRRLETVAIGPRVGSEAVCLILPLYRIVSALHHSLPSYLIGHPTTRAEVATGGPKADRIGCRIRQGENFFFYSPCFPDRLHAMAERDGTT